MELTEEELTKSNEAYNFIKSNQGFLIEKFASPKIYVPDERPVSLFMAGSPGAGKTEISKRLIEKFQDKLPIRIDADEIREVIPGYSGKNSYIFQKAASKGVNILFDYALDKNVNIILDGTFAYKDVEKNVARSLDHDREVEIYYIYQDPKIAWDLTKKREVVEHRFVSREVFISSFVVARENVKMIKSIFNDKVELNVIIKNFAENFEDIKFNISALDEHIPELYTGEQLNKLLP